MATIRAFQPFDQFSFDLNALYDGAYQAELFDDVGIRYDGHTYSDIYLLGWQNGYDTYASMFIGENFQTDYDAILRSGTIRGYAEVDVTSGYDVSTWEITGVSVSVDSVLSAMQTPSTADDFRLLNRMLAGDDRFLLSDGDDVAAGMNGNDSMYGRGGTDILLGMNGKDRVYGQGGDDGLSGGNGADRLDGGVGNDVLQGDAGTDTLTGGGGADVFVFRRITDTGRSFPKADLITDFQPGRDVIDLGDIDASRLQGGNDTFTFNDTDHAGRLAKGEIWIEHLDRAGRARDVTIIHIDNDNDPQSEVIIRLAGLHDLAADDFVL